MIPALLARVLSLIMAQTGCVSPCASFSERVIERDQIRSSSVIIEPVSQQKDPWISVDAYCCTNNPALCQQCQPVEVSRATETQWVYCVSISPKAQVEIGLSLIVQLLQPLNIQAAGGWEGQVQFCYQDSVTRTISLRASPCWRLSARYVFLIGKTRGEFVLADRHVFHDCVLNSAPSGAVVTASIWCNEHTVRGNARAVLDGEVQIAPFPQECGGPPPDPRFDGMTARPCIRPLVECGDVPPGGVSACGCIHEQ